MMVKRIFQKIAKIRKIPKRFLIFLLVVLITGIWFLSTQLSKKDLLQYTQVKRADIKEIISASGVLTGSQSASLKFVAGGKLAVLNVQSGDYVSVDDLVASLDTADLAINLQQARNTLKDKQGVVDKIINDIQLSQYGNGGFGNVGSANETQAQKQARTSAEIARDNAYDSVKAAQQAFNNSVLYAPISGVITQVNPVEGQVVSAADVIATIVDDSAVFFDSEVDESDIAKVSLGQRASISLNSYPDTVFTGTVKEIKPQTNQTSSGAIVVIVRISFDQSQIRFISNLNGTADIITKESFTTLLIPQEALVDDNSVYIKGDKGPQRVTVKTGLADDSSIEILEGLLEGQEVITNPSLIPPGKR